MRKKYHPEVTQTTGLHKTRRLIGKGISRRVVTDIDTTRSSAKAVVDSFQKVSALPDIKTFLKRFLVESGLPDDITEEGKFPFRSYLRMVPPKQERQTPLWYAAAITDELRSVQVAVERSDPEGAARAAFRAGDLYRESAIKFKWDPAVLAHQRVRKGGKYGGSKPKSLRGVELLLEERLKENPKASATKLWIGLLRYTPENPFNIGGHSLYRNAEQLCQDGDDKRIGFNAFRKYVYRIKSGMGKMDT